MEWVSSITTRNNENTSLLLEGIFIVRSGAQHFYPSSNCI